MTETESTETDNLLSDQDEDEELIYDKSSQISLWKKIGSALFFGVVSFVLTVVNKDVLTTWHFESVLIITIGQLATTIIVLFFGKLINVISFPNFNRNLPKEIMPLPLFHLGNMVSGLGGTQAMTLPMFTALRQFSVLMTMLFEFKVLGVKPSLMIQLSVWCMVGGAVVAAMDDLTFTVVGYSYVMFNNIMTAAYGVYIKQKLETTAIGKNGVMFYNSLLMIIPVIAVAWLTGDFCKAYKYKHWTNVWFLVQFISSCSMGFVLTYSLFLCMQYNSALTAAMVGVCKNILISYLGMLGIGGDYKFSLVNYIGINISILGSIFYNYLIFIKKDDPPKLPTKIIKQVENPL